MEGYIRTVEKAQYVSHVYITQYSSSKMSTEAATVNWRKWRQVETSEKRHPNILGPIIFSASFHYYFSCFYYRRTPLPLVVNGPDSLHSSLPDILYLLFQIAYTNITLFIVQSYRNSQSYSIATNPIYRIFLILIISENIFNFTLILKCCWHAQASDTLICG